MEHIRLSSFLHCIVTRKLSIDLSRQYAVDLASQEDLEARYDVIGMVLAVAVERPHCDQTLE